MWTYSQDNIGEFVEKEFGKTFTYRKSKEANAPFPHEIDVLDGYRYALVKKTVVYIIVDEDDAGQRVIEKWEIRSHKTYD